MTYENASRLLADSTATADQLHEAARSLRGSFERGDHTIGLLPGDAPEVMENAYVAAVERGSVPAMVELGSLYVRGGVASWAPFPEQDQARGIDLLRQADAAGSEEAALAWVRSAYFARDTDLESDALVRLQGINEADADDADALLLLGYFHSQGYGVEQDAEAALPFFEAASERGNADAAFELSLIHLNGLGVPADLESGVKWTHRAAELGSARAQSNLGGLYAMGHGVEKDPHASLDWYIRAGENGHARAAFTAGVMLLTGEDGIEQNIEAAAEHFETAEELGYDVRDGLAAMGIDLGSDD